MRSFFKILFPILTVCSMAFIFGNSLNSAEESSLQRGFVFQLLEDLVSFFAGKEVSLPSSFAPVLSKLAHVTEFFFFSVFFSLSLYVHGALFREQIWKELFCGLFVALTDEHLQTISPGRNPAVSDVMIDFSGVLIGFFTVWLITLARKERNP